MAVAAPSPPGIPANASARRLLPESTWQHIFASLKLSQREIEVVRCILEDIPEHRIADRLGISRHTVHTYTERLYRKLGVSSRVELTVRVFASFLSTLDEQQRQMPATPST